MKVLVVSQHFWPESFRINAVCASLVETGCAVTVLTGKPNYPEGKIYPGYQASGLAREITGDAVEVVRVPLIPRGRGSALRLVANYLSFVLSAMILGPWTMRGRRFDVVFVYGTSPILQAIAGIVLARLKRAPLVVWVQDLWPQSLAATGYVKNPLALRVVAAIVGWIYARSDMLLAQSKAFEASIRALAPPNACVRYHPNPGEAPAVEVSAGCLSGYQLPPGFTIVFAGNLGTAQALDTVLYAAEQTKDLTDVQWVLIGSGQRGAWLAAQVEQRSLTNVHLPGRFPPDQMPAILAQAGALLVSLTPDPTLSLTVPSKLQTYLAAGKPIIAALDGEGARVVEESGAGLCARAGDAKALGDAVRALRAMPNDTREQMGANGRRYHAEHFTPEHLTQALMGHFSDAIRARGR